MKDAGIIVCETLDEALALATQDAEKKFVQDSANALSSAASIAIFENNHMRIMELSSIGATSGDEDKKFGLWIKGKGVTGAKSNPENSLNDFSYKGMTISVGFDKDLENGLAGISFSHLNLDSEYNYVENSDSIKYYSNILTGYMSYYFTKNISLDTQLGYGIGALNLDKDSDKSQKTGIFIGEASAKYSINLNKNMTFSYFGGFSGSTQSIDAITSSSTIKTSELFGNIGVNLAANLKSSDEEFAFKPSLYLKTGYDTLSDNTDNYSKIKMDIGSEFAIEKDKAIYSVGISSQIKKDMTSYSGSIKIKVSF